VSTQTPTVTVTQSPTLTPTVTVSQTPGSSQTPTQTYTPSSTQTPTVTSTPTVTPTHTVTPSPSGVLEDCSVYEITVTELGNEGLFEYWYDECDETLCGTVRQSHGFIYRVPQTVRICAQQGTVVFPPQYPSSAYTLTTICNNCCSNPDVSPTPTPTNTPTISVSPTNTPTISVSPTNTPTISLSPSNNPTPTPTPSYTGPFSVFMFIPNLNSSTPTPTISYTPTETPTPTPTPTISYTPTETPMPTITPSSSGISYDKLLCRNCVDELDLRVIQQTSGAQVGDYVKLSSTPGGSSRGCYEVTSLYNGLTTGYVISIHDSCSCV
jgi:hypothetical protein